MELISKKELLELTGISYGQLYRWKREKLIPEEWFMKQSSYTGQETFFPREQIVERVRSIMELKDAYSLEELSKMLEPDATACIYREDLDLVKEIDREVLDQVLARTLQETFRIQDVAFLILLSGIGGRTELNSEEFTELVERTLPVALKQKNGDYRCFFFRAGEKEHMVLAVEDSEVIFDTGINLRETVAVNQIMSSIKVNYTHLFK